MKFANPWLLNLLWLIPAAVFLIVYEIRNKRRAMAAFADKAVLAGICTPLSMTAVIVKSVFVISAMVLAVIAIAGPQWGSRYQEVTQEGVDIIIAVDVSRSMLASDVEPSRLERARREIQDFINVVRGDRIGLVAFAGSAFLQCPLTLDYEACRMFLSELGPDLIPVQGTDIGAAIETAAGAFDTDSKTDRVILLITDGEDNEEKGLRAAGEADKNNIKIFVFGIGDTTGAPVPSAAGGFVKDRSGRMIMSKLDEQGLKKIADKTGGSYVRSVAGDLDLDLLYYSGIKIKTDAAVLKSGKIKIYEEKFMIFLLAAFVLLLSEGFINDRKETV